MYIYAQHTCSHLVALYDIQIYKDTVAEQLLLELKASLKVLFKTHLSNFGEIST